MKFILAKKQKMTQIFDDNGNVIPVTVVKAGPCPIAQVKTIESDGYNSVQIAFGDKKKMTKQLQGHLKDVGNFRHLREFRVENTEGVEKGQVIGVGTFEVGDKVKIVGTSKGKGFAGVVKRHGFKGQHATHGHKDQERMPGSIGSTGPARVFKGLRMPGHMGSERVTVKNLEIVQIDEANDILYVKGAVPGAKDSLIMILADGELKLQEEKKGETVEDVQPEAKSEEKVEEKQGEEKEVEKKESEAQTPSPEENGAAEETSVEESKVEQSSDEK